MKALAGTGVFRVDVKNWTGKVRLFQEKPLRFQEAIVEKLKERGSDVDMDTVLEIGKIIGSF